MVRKIVKRILSKNICPLKLILHLHTLSYVYAGLLATLINNGVHPKHRIMRYKEWFLDNIQPGWVVLDVGCNTGLMPELLAQKARFVYGIEINEDLIKEARGKRQRPNIEYICADATAYDFTGKEVDCVTLSNVLEHIEHRVDFLKKLIHNLKWNDESKKRFLIRVPMIDRDWITLYKKELGLEYRLDGSHFIEYTFEGFAEELRQANINIIQHQIRFGEIYAVCQGE